MKPSALKLNDKILNSAEQTFLSCDREMLTVRECLDLTITSILSELFSAPNDDDDFDDVWNY